VNLDLNAYLAALEKRHLANLTRSELTRALRALSSCYVERRDKLAGGAALDGAGKRAAFALFYGPMHLLAIHAIARELRMSAGSIHDIGCGTGVGGAALALASDATPTVSGIDRNPWAVTEANWTFRELGVRGRASVGDAAAGFPSLQVSKGSAMLLLAYSANEIAEPSRMSVLDKVAAAVGNGAQLLVVEPIAKRDRGWWKGWAERLAPLGVDEREWRLPANLPPLLREIANGAGLDPREHTARTLSTGRAAGPRDRQGFTAGRG
jgi:hypothetical protein